MPASHRFPDGCSNLICDKKDVSFDILLLCLHVKYLRTLFVVATARLSYICDGEKEKPGRYAGGRWTRHPFPDTDVSVATDQVCYVSFRQQVPSNRGHIELLNSK